MPQLPCHVSSDRGVTTERHQNLRFIFKPCAKRQFVAEYETRIRYHDKFVFYSKTIHGKNLEKTTNEANIKIINVRFFIVFSVRYCYNSIVIQKRLVV